MVVNEAQQSRIELEQRRKLCQILIDAIEELQHDRRYLLTEVSVTESIRKSMTKREPLLLNQDDETFHRAIVGVESQLAETRQERGTIPTIRAVNHDTYALTHARQRMVDTGEYVRQVEEVTSRMEAR